MSLSLRASQTPSAETGRRPRAPSRRRSGPQKEQAAALERELIRLRKKFTSPVFEEILLEATARVHRIAHRDDNKIRDEVFHAIDVQGCRNLEEIMEETSLTRWVLEYILRDLVMCDLVEMREEPACRRIGDGKPRMEFHPRHTPPGSNFQTYSPPSPATPALD